MEVALQLPRNMFQERDHHYHYHYSVMKTFRLSVGILLALGISLSDGSDGWHQHEHGKGQHHHHQHHHHHHHHHQEQQKGGDHHLRQRRHEWSPSQAIHEKQSNVKSQITFGHETMAASEWVFLTKNASTVRAHIGSTALLPCEVKKDSQFGMITWSRLEDNMRPYSLLTIGDQNYVEDKRFLVARPLRGLTNLAWSLRIKHVTPEDAGRYECQATTHPPQSIVTRLKVVVAIAQILGTTEKIIKSGSTLQLHCILKRATEEPLYVFWYHNDRMINYDTDRGVIVTKDKTGSTMSLKNASSGDSGNYTCVPYNIRAASVLVHVLSEGNSAAQLSNSAVSGQRGSSDQQKTKISSAKDQKTSSLEVTRSEKTNNNRQSPPSAAVHSGGAASIIVTSKTASMVVASIKVIMAAFILWTS